MAAAPIEVQPEMTPHDIQTEYELLGLTQGWRFLSSPSRNLTTARLAIITLNPGGERNLEASLAERWSSELGSAYRIEAWRGQSAGTAPLQRQIQRLCALLCEVPDDVLSGHFGPFRSKDWYSLPRREEAALFGLKLWRGILAESPARLIVCIGKAISGDGIAAACDARPVQSVPSGWGSLSIDRYLAPDGRRIIALPHLSRFGLFGEPGREKRFLEALDFGDCPPFARASAVSPVEAATLQTTPRAPASTTAKPGSRMVRRGAKRPGDATVHALVVSRVPLSGIGEDALMAALARVPRHELPARVLAEPSQQVPGSAVWWRGYLAGSLRRQFLEAE
jgi:hypothetical protein